MTLLKLWRVFIEGEEWEVFGEEKEITQHFGVKPTFIRAIPRKAVK